MDIEASREQRRQCLEELTALSGWVHGSLVQTRRMQAGLAKPFRYLSRSVGGRNRITYVAAGEMSAFRSAVKAGQRADALFERISVLSIAILKAEGKTGTGGAR